MSTFTQRVMVFIDGTNLLCRLADTINNSLSEGYVKIHDPVNLRADKMIEPAIKLSSHLINGVCSAHKYFVIRKYWFSSYQGNDVDKNEISTRLRSYYFEPVIFRKKSKGEKGVDIALTMSMLTNAFNQNYDVGILVAGDEDYVELVKEVKRYGQQVKGAFFENGLSPDLKLSFDHFHHLKLNGISNNAMNDCLAQLPKK